MPSPPPRSTTDGVQPSSVRQSAANAASQSTAILSAPTPSSCEPMWTWRPSASSPSPAQRRERRRRLLRRQPELRAAVAGLRSPSACRRRFPASRARAPARRRRRPRARRRRARRARRGSRPPPPPRSSSSALLLPSSTIASPPIPAARAIRELAERRRLRAEPLLARTRDSTATFGKRLDAVEDGRLQRRLAVRPRPRAQGLLAVDDERGAVRLRERARAEPAEDEFAALDPRRVGKESEHGQFFGSRKPTYQCVPSQNGLFFDWPQRQSAKRSRDGPWSPRGWSSSTAPVT